VKRRGGTYLGDIDGGIPKEKELVDAGDKNSPHETDDPGAKSGARHRGIIRVRDRGSDFGIRRLVLEHRGRRVEIQVI